MDEARAPAKHAVADVLIPVAVDQTYSYAIPSGLQLEPGDFVEVPLGARKTFGVVWGISPAAGGKLKSIEARLDFPPLPSKLREFLDWVAAWTLAPRGMVLRMAAHAAVEAGAEPVRIGLRATGAAPKRLTEARRRALAALPPDLAPSKAELARQAGVSPSVIDALIDDGALEPVALGPERAAEIPCPDFCRAELSDDQAKAAEILRAAACENLFKPILLEGVTGSGKTEVYFEAVAETLARGGQVLILMPEIALTSQFRDRFAKRFGVAPAEWHSELTPRRRARVWRAAADGAAQVIAGARSALFLPFKTLRLIIVDEEHEAAYKQEEGVIYHARDMAVVRARQEQCAVVLASATPSIETRENARQGRYGYIRLESRYAGRQMPVLKAIDLRQHGAARGKWISPPLVEALKRNLEQGEQSLLFLNRRGYAPLTLCRACGHKFECPNCSASLVEHRFRRALVCHHCGHVERRPDICPACGQAETLSACGPGVERLAEEAAELLPEARLLMLSSDMPGGTERMRAELQAIADHKFDLVIGTQLVAKGHNFPYLTLVGVVDADIGLSNGDPRAAERTFQLLNQVAGRAGRGEKPGRALLQTWQPEHPVLRALLSGDFERFYAEETATRRLARLPPFGRLAGVVVSGSDRNATEVFARALARAACLPAENAGWSVAPPGELPGEADIAVYGPAEAPIAMVRGKYRFRLLIKAPRKANIQAFLRAMRGRGPKPTKDLKISIDVDPQSFL
ncbi:primosomal protein N' [Rhodoblastus sphagnicola]|uniref:Replication restart protein PriA n=1 Tax=Rhodoblastus sphagnicola TaxID=333368 RepID=A0A2S6NBI5_9HYPH|nr:primosomal protein N' [Rhodoblastus sphagnicola]MBB4197058.1 primosomal protein N' (replication factor Y) [Rhodoblastus sphagnicola]PPQ31954.1 primosomal protein N' [Rhodoblastus sphagnicola]